MRKSVWTSMAMFGLVACNSSVTPPDPILTGNSPVTTTGGAPSVAVPTGGAPASNGGSSLTDGAYMPEGYVPNASLHDAIDMTQPPCTPRNGVCLGGPFPEITAGYERFMSSKIVVPDQKDMTVCQMITGPVAEDMDIVSVTGAQSKTGHHLTLFGVRGEAIMHEVGEVYPCEPDSGHTDLGTWLGSGATFVPEGTALRLKAGQALMLNQHYINAYGDGDLLAQTYIDVKMVPAAQNPGQKLASVFAVVNSQINVPPGQMYSTPDIDCEVPQDMYLAMASNHMHEWGVGGKVSVIKPDGTEIILQEDLSWSDDFQLNPPAKIWPIDAPFHIEPGDKVRAICHYFNDTFPDTLKFPREMCVGALFAILPEGETEISAACQTGVWTPGNMAH